jgi:hypothetical protein
MDPKKKFYEELLKQTGAANAEKLRGAYAPKPVEAQKAEADANHALGVPSHAEVQAKYGSPLEEPGMLEQVLEFLNLRKRQMPQATPPAALPDKIAPKRPGEESESFIRRRMGDEAWEEEGY